MEFFLLSVYCAILIWVYPFNWQKVWGVCWLENFCCLTNHCWRFCEGRVVHLPLSRFQFPCTYLIWCCTFGFSFLRYFELHKKQSKVNMNLATFLWNNLFSCFLFQFRIKASVVGVQLGNNFTYLKHTGAWTLPDLGSTLLIYKCCFLDQPKTNYLLPDRSVWGMLPDRLSAWTSQFKTCVILTLCVLWLRDLISLLFSLCIVFILQFFMNVFQ